ncbi:Cytochrome P450 [Glarea lozoyensis ATCC 20868]|uniref:Cytochrome P450 n=1 Tax=Glarea lozoyensis (strain ATCC 20868 / MF5171) TaxID=1116229 RepID=S3D4P2_GLAL2|nr:Cytochrome P450 [Glarea lozoyensis ATCC 20868]EPE27046.1 Cytochrome P450 [Glarea lozoyensis ATCC 20868]
MRELSFHSSLKKNLLHLHFPTLAKLLGRLAEPRPTPLTDAYVQSTAQQTDAGEHTLLHTLQTASENLGEDVIVAECLDHLAAGIDTTGDALCFLLYQLSLPENSAIQDKLADEVHNNREQNFEDLPYLDAVIMESLRLYPPIPMSQPRIVPKGGRVVDGWFVAEGMVVGAQAWSVHRLNGVFSDSEKFQPERWLDTESRREMEKFGDGGDEDTGQGGV